MKKILLLTLMFGFMVSAGAKDFYLTGEFNGWTPSQEAYRFQESNGIYTLSLASIYGELKITTSKWEEQYGSDETIRDYGVEYKCVRNDNGSNITLPDNPATDVVITFDYNKKTFRVDRKVTLYLVGDFNAWTLLPKYEFAFGEGVYSLTVPSFTGRFRIRTSDESISFGGDQAFSVDTESRIYHDGSDLMMSGFAGFEKVKLTLNPQSTVSTTGVEALEDEEWESPEYYTIDGIRVDNPSKGIFIKKSGHKTQKIIR